MADRPNDSWASSEAVRTSMLGNKRTGTKPEQTLRSALHAEGLRFRKDYRIDAGGMTMRPDIVFTRAKVAVFVDGCFWHSCPVHATTPTRNAGYWLPKLARNAERDLEQVTALESDGWTAIRIWEHEALADAVRRVNCALSVPPTTGTRQRKGTPREGMGM